ncbi:gamma-glutamylcyclotransferase [Aneurinibacillus uraniidurans]|uniref:gamma-glutamylcyclotransferase n=1 Tax=Aneurinibacillus uraniidurans TaxID=2966586 RepID=UPI002349C307|nr:gamma-glutamylcyclotransferase [Aneurinibacillus sp. B1]WCN36820.1 gamma-glutamylcyclotransferase [Aneurinibacillus sp. B1]
MINKAFVYGTLCKGESNHHVVSPFVQSTSEATIQGWLYHLPYGYPTMIPGAGKVSGQLLELRDVPAALAAMDWLEGYEANCPDNEYERIVTTVVTEDGQTHDCYVYIYPDRHQNRLEPDAIFLPAGDWRAYQRGEAWEMYFAYGSCMNRDSFAVDVPVYRVLSRAVLDDYRIGFTHYSAYKWQGGVADVLPASGRQTEGVLYAIPADLLPALDRREGVKAGIYERIMVEVKVENRMVQAWTYTVVNKQPDMAPSPAYRDTIIAGSDLLSEGYMQELTRFMADLSCDK